MPGNTEMIRIDMGNVTDYYKPKVDVTWCSMLTSRNLFEWSSDGNGWETPSYSDFDAFGGSEQFWPSDNEAYPDDQRRFLSFWGSSNQAGGCCTTDYSSAQGGWGQSFTMSACRANGFYSFSNPAFMIGVVSLVVVVGMSCWCVLTGG